jgi:hypothetical protein
MPEQRAMTRKRVGRRISASILAVSLAGGFAAGFFASAGGGSISPAMAQRGGTRCSECGAGDERFPPGSLTCKTVDHAAHMGCLVSKSPDGSGYTCHNIGTCRPSVTRPWWF